MKKKLKSTAYPISQYLKPTSRNHEERIREAASRSQANTALLRSDYLLIPLLSQNVLAALDK